MSECEAHKIVCQDIWTVKIDLIDNTTPNGWCCRDAEKAALVSRLALDGVIYMPGLEDTSRSGADNGRAANINRVLRKLYPRHVEVKGEAPTCSE